MGLKVWIKALLILAIIIASINVSAYAATGTWQPVKPEWIIGVASVRVPYLGHLRIWHANGLNMLLSIFIPAVIYAFIVRYLIKREKNVFLRRYLMKKY